MKRIPLIVAWLSLGAVFTGCAFNSVYWTPPPPTVVHESDLASPPGPGQAKYLYYYQREVYFNLDDNRYTYPWQGSWHTHARLPWIFRGDLGSYVVLDLPREKPERFHAQVLEQFPPSFPILVVSSDESMSPPAIPAVPGYE
ncbi:MAG TPA: hypothetical protein PLS90_07680 [Candidatus Sumerlaeota bacterium]|nr:hypothetical protein [Candidatus Sumerlaeota bacterium]HOR27204.1 hypothetical protein [Candidatus Sumerlaeota bacterium]HPK02323.1 hypothetical protein [Candidatus Sumerlaeota bacterium]